MVQAEKVFDQANQMAAEAFINIRIIAAFMLETRISELYQKLLAGPSKDSLKQALASGAGYAIGQGVIFLVSTRDESAQPCSNHLVWKLLIVYSHNRKQLMVQAYCLGGHNPSFGIATFFDIREEETFQHYVVGSCFALQLVDLAISSSWPYAQSLQGLLALWSSLHVLGFNSCNSCGLDCA